MYNQYVVFILDDKNFAIKIEHVIEIIGISMKFLNSQLTSLY